MDCRLLLSHPKLPIFFLFTTDGRIISFAVMIKILPPPPLPDEDSEFSGDDDEVELTPRQGCCYALQKILSRSVVRSAQRALLVMLCTRFPTSNQKLLVPTKTALYATKNVAIWRFFIDVSWR